MMSNSIENLLGSQELISLRTRGKSARRFTRVDELEAEAQAKFKGVEDALNAELEEVNRRLSDLQRGKDESERAILSPEQTAEIQGFRESQLDTQKRLRAVRRYFRQEIESLGVWLQFLNIALMPILIILLSFVPAAWRAFRMTSS